MMFSGVFPDAPSGPIQKSLPQLAQARQGLGVYPEQSHHFPWHQQFILAGFWHAQSSALEKLIPKAMG
jgi:hypothetical protein